jgi:hypothetical protein
MPKICYQSKRFKPATLETIEQANGIIDEYLADGYELTVRQLYYQFVARDLIANTQKQYNRIKSVVSDARLAGMIDWDAIVDRTRNLRRLPHWSSPASVVSSAAAGYAIEKWKRQPCRVEVWVEKEALAGVFERICDEHDVPWFACRGYVSQSEMWRAGQRMISYNREGQRCHVLHFGDHDPSGLDMTRDIRDRFELFGARVSVDRVALNFDQVEEYDPPPNFAKQTDARFAEYQREYGDESWELDALEPAVLSALVERHVIELRDDEVWAEDVEEQEDGRQWLQSAADNWDDVVSFMQEEG